jgi:hypothetical protein
MIPAFNQSGVLPPFLPQCSPTMPAAMAPYRATMEQVITKFGSTSERKVLLMGLLDYRAEMRAAGFVDGFQWIDGSFIEDCEAHRRRPPSDIDVVTFSRRLSGHSSTDWDNFVATNPQIFDPLTVKNKYNCDAYFVDLTRRPEFLVSSARYWFGIFSHQRDTFLWKGLLEVPLGDDIAARQLIGGSGNAAQIRD